MRPLRIVAICLARWRALFHRDAVAHEIQEELDFHLASRIAEYEREGLSQAAARRKAEARVGSLAVHADRGYAARGGGVMETVRQDLRHAWRLQQRQPAFTALAVLTLALGIGASTAIFSVVDAAILRPLPYPAPDRLVTIAVDLRLNGDLMRGLSPSIDDVRAFSAHARTVISHAAIAQREFRDPVLETDTPERVPTMNVTEEYLAMFGIAPLHGRDLSGADMIRGAPRVVVLGHAFWQSRFGGDAAIVGRAIRFDGAPTTVIGVLPPFKPSIAVWRPLLPPEHGGGSRRGMGWTVHARLQPHATAADASEPLTALAKAQDPQADSTRVRLSSLLERVSGEHTTTVTMLVFAVAGVWLIGCVNVAGLLLARGAARRPEFAIRASLGATRGRLIRQIITECMLTAVAAGIAGALIASVTLDALVANIPMTLADDAPARIDGFVLGACAALTLATTLMSGLWPAVQLSRTRAGASLAAASRFSRVRSRNPGRSLIAIEMALAVVLLAASGLMLRSFVRILSVDMGFDPANVLTMETSTLDPDPAVQANFYPTVLESIRAIPGVSAAGAVDYLPLNEMMAVGFASAIGGRQDVEVTYHQVLPGYFEAMGMRLRAGRFFTGTDRKSPMPLAILDETAAREMFSGAPALGRQINIVPGTNHTIVGIVADTRSRPTSGSMSAIYEPFVSSESRPPQAMGLTVVVRADESAPGLAHRMRDAALAAGSRVMVERISRGRDLFADTIDRPRQRTVLLSLVGALGVLLAVVGLGAMTSYAVARRTREIGVRMAFGARAGQVVGTMVRDAFVPAAIGIAIGSGVARIATGVIESFLFRTSPTDAPTFIAVAALLAIASVVAAWIPARRAARVDPVTALRTD